MSRSHGRVALATMTLFVLLATPPPHAAGDSSGLFGWLVSDLNLVSVEQEAQISQQIAGEVESKERMVRDPVIEAFTVSVTVRDWLPAVLSVTPKICTPASVLVKE